MTDVKKPSKERLYLDKGQREVYVDACRLTQHQIEGIRFLYRQYIKKKPGVIVNNPEGYGKSIQVALFLDSIRAVLTNPVLILCEDDNKVNNWKQVLIKWTKYNEEDVVVDSSNVYAKKTIFIKKGTHLEAPYSRRDWGVVVLKSDFVLKQLVKTPLKATFKIWLTTIDMRKDLEMFNAIYCWLYSEKKFDIKKYIDSISDVDLPLARATLMNSFLEDIVIIKNDFKPIKKPELIEEKSSPKSKVTRKNKDATGTKIKRSKKTKESDTASDKYLRNYNPVTNSIQDCKNDLDDTVNGLDVENFIKQKQPVVCEEYEFLNESESTDTENLSFTSALNDIVENENELNDAHSESILDEEVMISTDERNDTSVKNPKNTLLTSAMPEIANSNGTDKNKCTDTEVLVTEKKNKIDIIQAIADMEEKAMKKFKNTILDDLF